MAHVHHGALKVLKDIVIGLPSFSTDHQSICKGCAMGKYAKAAFPIRDNKSKGILDLIHSDICGPMSIESIGGFNYYVSFINDHSRKTWIYFLKSKETGEVFKRFQEFKALVENQTRKKIKVLRTDNGDKYPSKTFKEF